MLVYSAPIMLTAIKIENIRVPMPRTTNNEKIDSHRMANNARNAEKGKPTLFISPAKGTLSQGWPDFRN